MVEVGSILEGKVVRIMQFGAFVDIGSNKSGLVHISEISKDYVKDINSAVKVNDSVKVKVIGIDDKGRIALSIKQAQTKPEPPKERGKKNAAKKQTGPIRPADIDWGAKSTDNLSFEDKLTQFKHDSDEKIQALRRSADSKRSGGYSRRGGHSF